MSANRQVRPITVKLDVLLYVSFGPFAIGSSQQQVRPCPLCPSKQSSSQRKSDLGIPLPYTWLNPSTRPRVWPRFGSPKGRQERDPHHDHQGHPTTPQAEQPCHQTRAQRQTPQSQKSGEVTRRASAANGRTTTATCTTGDRQSRRGGGRKVKFSSSDENCAYGGV